MDGAEFRRIRESLGLSREKLASMMDVTSATIGNAERSTKVKDAYMRHLFVIRDASQPAPAPDVAPNVLAAYNALVAAASTLYRLAKEAAAQPRRPLGRPVLHGMSPQGGSDPRNGVTLRNRAKDMERPMIAERLDLLRFAKSAEEKRMMIVSWSLSTPEDQVYLRTWTDEAAIGNVLGHDDARVSLPPEIFRRAE